MDLAPQARTAQASDDRRNDDPAGGCSESHGLPRAAGTRMEFMLVWPLPLYVAMIHDFTTRRVVHPVYVIGVLAMLLMRVMLPLRETETWLGFTRWLATFY